MILLDIYRKLRKNNEERVKVKRIMKECCARMKPQMKKTYDKYTEEIKQNAEQFKHYAEMIRDRIERWTV
jgi:ketopantoate reductase